MDILLESMWGLEQEEAPATLAEIAKQNRAMHGPPVMSLSMWDRAAALERLETGLDPFAAERVVAKVVVEKASLRPDTNITLKQVIERVGDEQFIAAFKEFGGDL